MFLLDLLSWFFFLVGGFLLITGSVGVLRLPDFFSRVHAAGITESLASPLILIGLIIQVGLSLESVKLLLIIVFLLATSPSATHAMASAALRGGAGPKSEDIPDLDVFDASTEEAPPSNS